MTNTIKEIHHGFIPLSQGIRLAYRAWLPDNAVEQPVPAILEYLPYRKNDGTIVRDEITLPATAKHGYACVRVDIRGTGESDGLFDDEYSEQELSDGEQVIDWISRQTWCNGRVGMAGISWGGFNSLQLAYRQPPALKAIITLCSTDDRFNEDIHYAGGCLLNDNLDWAAFFWSYALARCPDPRLIGDAYKDQWLQRLEQLPFLPSKWLAEQHKNDYWKHGSVSEDYRKIKIPVYAIGGWADAYRDTVFRLVENLASPCKGLVGPWAHVYPNIAYPGPKLDYVKESVRWWDKWLKGVDNDIMDEPKLQYYLMDSVRPAVDYEHRAGTWVGENCWPPDTIKSKRFYLHSKALSTEALKQTTTATIRSPETTGSSGGKLMVGIGVSGEFPADQRADDQQSLSFDTSLAQEELYIVGQPVVRLKLSSDQALANIAVRLCDIHPGGESTLMTYAVLNLAHRDSNEKPTALVPGAPYDVKLALHHIAYRLPAGHRLRLSVSNAYWPLIWPSPYRDTLSLELSQSHIDIPLRTSMTENDNPALQEFKTGSTATAVELRKANTRRTVQQDPETGQLSIRTETDYGHFHHHSCDTAVDFTINQVQSIHPEDPCSAVSDASHTVRMQQGQIDTTLKSHYQMTCSEQHFYIKASWRAWLGETCIMERHFDKKIRRQLV